MVLDGVKEQFESQKEIGFCNNNSSFILCDCIKNEKNDYILKYIIPLENHLCNIKIDRKNMVLTDIDGNILRIFDDSLVNDTSIEYVSENDLIISNYMIIKPNFVAKKIYKKINHYHYDNTLELVNTIYEENNGKLENFDLINEDTIYIETLKKLFIPNSRLYSIKKKDYISPTFRELQPVEKTKDKI